MKTDENGKIFNLYTESIILESAEDEDYSMDGDALFEMNFEVQGKYYNVLASLFQIQMGGSFNIHSDEDYTGRIKYATINSVDKFVVTEIDDEDGELIRNDEQIKNESPKLYDQLLKDAKTKAEEEWREYVKRY